jgi:hypothetical protein
MDWSACFVLRTMDWSADSDGGSRKPEESEPGYDDGMFYIFMISMISMCAAGTRIREHHGRIGVAQLRSCRNEVDSCCRYTVPATGSKLYSWSVSASSTKNIEVDKFASRRLQEKK